MDQAERVGGLKFLIRDRDAKYTDAFDAVFTVTDVRIIRTPVQAPRANATCERWISSAGVSAPIASSSSAGDISTTPSANTSIPDVDASTAHYWHLSALPGRSAA